MLDEGPGARGKEELKGHGRREMTDKTLAEDRVGRKRREGDGG